MLTPESQDTFDIEDWQFDYDEFVARRQWGLFGQPICGPGDAWLATYLRLLCHDFFSWGNPCPADLFILSQGDSPRRDATKIGGLPFWPRGRSWPRGASGTQLPFLAQFNLSESADIICATPGNILLLFGLPHDNHGLEWRWEQLDTKVELIMADEVPVPAAGPAYYGTRWRTFNYPDAIMRNDEEPIWLEDGRRLSQEYFVPNLCGMQIGPAPFQTGSFLSAESENMRIAGDEIICCLTSVVPAVDMPYPFLNRREPFSEQEARERAFNISSIPISSDGYGLLYVISGKDEIYTQYMNL